MAQPTEGLIAFPLPGGGSCVLRGPLDRAAIEHAIEMLRLQARALAEPAEPERAAAGGAR